ncbi:uncharacterized protein LOC129783557 [Falco peregrinus]|uniref:uncharacterized protein LOC129783557 n=1 Tax=Falco peregrinus TaxID=8954 RepID=UPI00247A92B0|nr:uncharacterized protein LOC129783557 [Falco peregrinus]
MKQKITVRKNDCLKMENENTIEEKDKKSFSSGGSSKLIKMPMKCKIALNAKGAKKSKRQPSKQKAHQQMSSSSGNHGQVPDDSTSSEISEDEGRPAATTRSEKNEVSRQMEVTDGPGLTHSSDPTSEDVRLEASAYKETMLLLEELGVVHMATELWRSSPPRITTIRRTGGTLPGPGTIGTPWTRGVLTTPQTSLVAVRCASKKTGGSYKNVGGRSPGKRYGFKKVDGEFVHAGNILATQRLMRWHPGAHVGMGRNKTLYALEDGIVRYTKEVYVPLPRSSESREAICCLPKGAVLYKAFINVIPVTEVGSFKLVTML